jgi:hypothetical protein
MSDAHPRPNRIRRIMIVDPGQFRFPMVCVVCGSPDAACVSYKQDHAPIPLGVGPVAVVATRTTQVSIPYCEQHSRRFRRRFRILRTLQPVGAVVVLAAALAGHTFKSMPAYGVAGATLLLLAASIFVIKPCLYDVFLDVTPERISIRGGGQEFLEQVLEANPGNAVAR